MYFQSLHCIIIIGLLLLICSITLLIHKIV